MVRRRLDDRRVALNMTPMIDVVFQLLAFFVMTFTVLAREGDFEIEARRLPPTAVQPDVVLDLPERVMLEAAPMGELTGLVFRGRRYSKVAEFTAALQAMERERHGPFVPVPVFEIVCQERLKYEHVVRVMDVVAPVAKEVKLSVRSE